MFKKMTKKGSFANKDGDAEGRRTPQESSPGVNKQTPSRIPSGKLLVPAPVIEEKDKTEKPGPVVGKFGDVEEVKSKDSPKARPVPPPVKVDDMASGRPRGLLTKAESSGSLRRGTPRPQDLKKTVSSVKFVLEASGLEQVEEEDYEMA